LRKINFFKKKKKREDANNRLRITSGNWRFEFEQREKQQQDCFDSEFR
jgi:hypothetical protein